MVSILWMQRFRDTTTGCLFNTFVHPMICKPGPRKRPAIFVRSMTHVVVTHRADKYQYRKTKPKQANSGGLCVVVVVVFLLFVFCLFVCFAAAVHFLLCGFKVVHDVVLGATMVFVCLFCFCFSSSDFPPIFFPLIFFLLYISPDLTPSG